MRRTVAGRKAKHTFATHEVDIFLGEESGLDLARHLVEDGHGQGDAATVILISTHAEADLADLIAASPAAGFLPKAELSAKAIGRIVAGRPGWPR